MEYVELDSIDRDILSILINEARITNQELGNRVGLSPNAAGARVQRLQKNKVITGFSAQIDYVALGLTLEVSVDVWQKDQGDSEAFHRLVAADDRIVECFHLTGPLDFRLRARARSPEDLDDLLTKLKRQGGIRQTDSRLVLHHVPVSVGGGS